MSFSDPFSMKIWMTTSDVADLLQVSERTVRRWIADGRLPARRIVRQLRIHRKEIDRIMFRARDGEGFDDL